MKIQCDVCNKDDASVFCTADEAVLCDGCDHRVHHANKLASKHQRFSLHRPSSKQYPLCDVCQEKRAFMFCQQDRAILCKDCDLSIHSANEHTQKHDRFLLTGVKLSASSKLYSSTPSNSVLINGSDFKSQSTTLLASSSSSSVLHPPSIAKNAPSGSSTTLLPPSPSIGGSLVAIEGTVSTSASSISQYLIETLPGWQIEDFLDSYSVPFGFSKGDDMFPLLDADIERDLGSFSPENMGIWVPQAPPPLYSSQMDWRIGHNETKESTNIKGSRSRLRDDNFTVPQISPDSNSKRPRSLW
ncbi:B-box zinc finger protein 21-like [Gastrolobium bilobum]|uniref:B-box zinc finger protein 21-like n=1 Tax=Gastrolobium bilobum TaxID=150636 RepID=UPI002AB2275F|nr:B-box zinc finger protein 21-like [Gastrolobium bilobum]